MTLRSCNRSSSYPVIVATCMASSLWLPAAGCSGTIDGAPDAHRDHAVASGAGGTQSAAGDGMPSSSGSGGAQGQAGNGSKPQDTCGIAAVGATPLQRLTRDEYGNSVRDLLELPSVDVSGIAQDERVGPFSGNNVAPISDLIVEQYLSAAEKAAAAAGDDLEKLVTCDRDALGDEACADKFVNDFGLRVYRRPLDADERDAYHALFTSYAADGYTEALRVIVQTMLQSPNFLYRVELVPSLPAQAATEAAVDLDAYELATRLSFFLVRTTPDAALLQAAAAGDLDTTDALRKQAQRLLDDTRSRETLASFHLQWLELDGLSALTKDADAYPAFDAELAKAMQHETERFVDYVVRDGEGTLEALLTAPYSFLEGPLFDLYGVKAPTDSGNASAADEKTELDPAQRAGLLTQASFLSVHGHTNQSAPVQRGKVVIRNVLCEALPDPPPNVNTTPPAPSPGATTRQRFAAHEKDAVCAGCHVRIDGVGMGFENYDGIGAFRTRDGDQEVDASGKLVGTIDLDGEFDGAVELAKKLATSREVSDCVAKQWLRYSLGRFETEQDTCSLTGIKGAFDASGHDIRALLEAIVVSDAFRKKAASAEAAP